MTYVGLPWWLRPKESACSAGYPDLTPRWERSAGKGNGNPLQYSCLRKFHGQRGSGNSSWHLKELDVTERLSFT